MIHNQQQQQQQQTSKATMMSNYINNTKAAPSLTYATTTQEAIKRYTFVPVFESTEDIQAPSSTSVADKSKGLELTKPSKGQVPWCCIECDAETFGHKCTCCGRPRETGALRVFVGKLNREGSAEMTSAMLQTMLSNPSQDLSGPVLHIEPHTHASNGRGKGCTWIYVRSAKDVKTIVDAFHHRTFIAVHPTSGEVGFVPFPTSCDEAEIESIFQHDHDNRQRFVHYLLHRGRVTAEIPESMQQDVFAKLSGSFVGKKFPGKVYHNNNQNQNQHTHHQDFVAPSYANPIKPSIDASHTQQMMHYVNYQAPAYNAQMANIMTNNIPQGFQQQIIPPPPAPPSFPMNSTNNNNNNTDVAASVALSPKPYQAPTGVSPMTPLPPRPELATSSWYQEDSDNEDNHFGTSSSEDELQQQQSSATSTPTNKQKTTCKQVCNRGRRYMWNPY